MASKCPNTQIESLIQGKPFSTKQPAILREALKAGRTVFLGPDRWRFGDKSAFCLEELLREMRLYGAFPSHYDDETLIDYSGDFALASHFLGYAEPVCNRYCPVDFIHLDIAEDWAGIQRGDLAFDAVLAALKMGDGVTRFGVTEKRKDYVARPLRINSKYVVNGPDPNLRAKAAKLPAGQSLARSGIVPPVQVAAHGVTEQRRLAHERWLEEMKARYGARSVPSPVSGQDAVASTILPPLKPETPASEPRNRSKDFFDFLDSGED
jgi:hypothetical protein